MPEKTTAPTREDDLPEWISEHLDDPALLSLVAGGGWRVTAAYYRGMFVKSKQREAELQLENEKLRAKIRELEHQLLGQKSETGTEQDQSRDQQEGRQPKRSRGAQKGHRHHSRKKRPQLPEEKRKVPLPEGVPCCPQCGKPFTTHSRQCERIEIQVRIVRVVYEVEGAMRSCNCSPAQPPIWAAPPPNIIPKSPYDTSIWTEAILSKFYSQIPLARTLSGWSLCGLELSEGVLTNGLKTLEPLFDPIFERIATYQREHAGRLQADETGWPVFGDPRKRSGRQRWQLWVFRTAEAVVFLIKPSRAAEVILEHLPENVVAILLVDRYSAYKKAARLLENLVLAFCWAHVRRDFIGAKRTYQDQIGSWADEWIQDIATLFHLEKLRQRKLQSEKKSNPDIEIEVLVERLPEHQEVRKHLEGLETRQKQQLENVLEELAGKGQDQRNLGERRVRVGPKQRLALLEQKRILQSLGNHWEGLTLFLKYPDIPLDNNASERDLRGPAVGRKNYYGSGADWSLALTAKLFSIFATLELFGINVRTWLTEYLQLCANHGGRVPAVAEIEGLMPWQMEEQMRERLSRPPPTNDPDDYG